MGYTPKIGRTTVCSCYSSPNGSLPELEELLTDINPIITGAKNVIIAGDVNAKATAWGARKTDARGQLLECWAASLGLTLHNQGDTPTCDRAQGNSIIDLTWTRGNISAKIRNWRVDRWSESHSDHNYIWFNINEKGRRSNAGNNGRMSWNIKKFDETKFDSCILGATWRSDNPQNISAEEKARKLVEMVTHACNEAMPKKRHWKPPRYVY